jgi:hypothetical protein
MPWLREACVWWGLWIGEAYLLLQSLLFHAIVKYLGEKGSQYRLDLGPADKVKYSQAIAVEDTQADISSANNTNPDLEVSRVEKEKKIESIDGYEI